MGKGIPVKVGGTYAQYAVTNAYQCVPLEDDMSFNVGASFFVNPITAVGLVEQVTKDKGTSVVVTAAASQLGKMLIRLFQEEGVLVIATVRKEEQAEDLIKNFEGVRVLNSQDEDFLKKLAEVTEAENCKHLLECIGGKVCGEIVSKMPTGSTCIVYGNLSREKISEVDTFALIANKIELKGFLLNQWIETKGSIAILMMIRRVRKMLKSELSSEVQKEFDLKDIKEAIKYYENNMSAGKVILKPWGVDN
jgi:NADPH2:quinone reductase